MNRILRSEKGSTLVLILVVLTMLAAFGLAHLLMSRTGIRQSQVLFKGIDANFLLEGLINQAENKIRQQANNYDKTPAWFNTFRDTSIGGSSGFQEVDLSGTPIKTIADSSGYEIKVVAQFIANSRVYAFKNGGVKEDITLSGGKEKWGQLEIKAQVRIGDNYYHAHAAKDVKVINPLTLSHDGQYNGLHKYNMYIKYAYDEYAGKYPAKFKDGSVIKSVGTGDEQIHIRGGNFVYNRKSDEEEDISNNKLANKYYFVRLNNGPDNKKGKVYLGTSGRKRNLKNKILIDLPRGSYGDFYSEQIRKNVYDIKYEEKKWLAVKVKVPSGFGSKWKKYWQKVPVARGKDHAILKSINGANLEKYWKATKDKIENDETRLVYPDDDDKRDGELVKYMILTGSLAKNGEPVVEKTVSGFEFCSKPWTLDLVNPGFAVKSDLEDSEGNQRKDLFMVNFPPNHVPTKDGMNSNGFSAFLTAQNYGLYFTKNGTYNGEEKNQYYSFSHSSLVNDTTLSTGLNGTDTNDGFRAHPVLQLRGIWANGSWSSDTEVEGNVWARYFETYYLVSKEKDDKENFTGNYIYNGLGAYDYDGDDITGYNGDKLFGIQVPNMSGMKGQNISKGLLNIVEKNTKIDTGDPDRVSDKNNMKWSFCYGPQMRHENTNDPQAETLRSNDPNNNNGYNSRAIFVPYNGKGNPAPISQTGDTIREDPDFANVYLDKVTAVFTNFKEFSEKNMKFDGENFILYLNGIYMINSLDVVKLPGLDGVKKIKYVGKGALLFAGNVVISCDIVPQDEDHDLLILATIGRRNEDGSLGSSVIGIWGPKDEPLDIRASMIAMNRDFIESRKNLGLIKPCAFTFTYGANIYGHWASDIFNYYPNGPDKELGENPNLKGTNLKYDPRFSESHAGDSEYYLADIGLPFSFWKVWKNKESEI